ncbi:MAG: UvrD-helicase domain-containing protein [Candidatus Nanopelagicales bacterium]
MTTPFDLLAPLPTGTTLLEASAGTGKTYAIAALATRYIAEGRTTIDQMLMITFGRSATRELRERVRRMLAQTRDALRDPAGAACDDPVIGELVTRPVAQRTVAADRLGRAMADFDAGTIATTHQFCQHALAGLGIRADTNPGEAFVESIAELVDEVVDDFYVRKYGGPDEVTGRIDYALACHLARAAVGDPQAALDAGPVTDGSIEQTRLRFAQAVRDEVLRRRRARRLVTFDDLVLRLRDALTDPLTGAQACQRLRDTYQVVLVDEFQDTDPAQWTILRQAFHGARTLILIGDPKQAIYAFRGADVYSYLDAAAHADHHATLPTNWRSDAAVVSGIADLVGGLELGDERIVVHPVAAAHQRSRLSGTAGSARVRLRTLHPDDDQLPAVGTQRTAVAVDVAADIVSMLTGPGRLTIGSEQSRPIAPGDIAVLTGTNAQADTVRDALAHVGVPAVVTSSTSVFATEAARQWRTLLDAMHNPRARSLRDAALTDFLGRTAEELATHGDQVDADTSLRLRTWAPIVEGGSVAALMATIVQQTQLATRVLSRPDGERQLTDLRHIAGVLHAQQRRNGAGLVGLLDWLTEQIQRAFESSREPTGELTRRLETDADAVQVLTVHTSKGLEFPIAYVPFGWDRPNPTKDRPIRCHDTSGRRVLDVRGEHGIGRSELLKAQDDEEAGESLRLLYVALTRASCQVVVHWASSKQNTRTSPLHRVLSARTSGTTSPKKGYVVEAPPVAGVARSPWIRVEPVRPAGSGPAWVAGSPEQHDLTAAPFSRAVDAQWRRTSYSGLTAGVHTAEQAPSGFRDDEPDEPVQEPAAVSALESEAVSPFADLPAGAAFGTLVHHVLEVVDTSAPDLAAEVEARCRERLVAQPMAGVSGADLTGALIPALQTPLGALAANRSLAEFSSADRLAELDFELPMGDPDGTGRTLSDLAALLRQHLSGGDPLSSYPDRLRQLTGASLRGYLSGSIDAVLRVPMDGSQRFLVVDYKTNLLRDPGEPGVERLLAGYRPEALASSMMDAHYPLQALLYSAALHRYLRWRLAGYDPARHLGGVLYLYLRGMAGARGYGVFEWRPPAALIVELSDLLDGRQP